MTNFSQNPFDLFWDLPVATSTKTYDQSVTADAYTIQIPMVGITKNDLKVNIDDNKLIVSANPPNKSKFITEHKYSWFLNEDSDISNINAKLDNGLLTLIVPKIKPTKRAVNIQIN